MIKSKERFMKGNIFMDLFYLNKCCEILQILGVNRFH